MTPQDFKKGGERVSIKEKRKKKWEAIKLEYTLAKLNIVDVL